MLTQAKFEANPVTGNGQRGLIRMQQETPVIPAVPAVPPVPAAPVLLPGQVTVGGAVLSSPSAVYQGFRAQRRELGRQMDELENTREQLSSRIEEPLTAGADKKGLEQRITAVDERIATLDRQIAQADAQVAGAAAIPGAAVEPPSPPRTGPSEEVSMLGGMFIFFVLLPISIAYARRIWRHTAKVITTFPKELAERLIRVEQSVESTAIEVERIGEGQRFMTRLFTEGAGAHALPAARQASIQNSGGENSRSSQ